MRGLLLADSPIAKGDVHVTSTLTSTSIPLKNPQHGKARFFLHYFLACCPAKPVERQSWNIGSLSWHPPCAANHEKSAGDDQLGDAKPFCDALNVFLGRRSACLA